MAMSEMLSTHPTPAPAQDVLRQCIDACFRCAQTCVSCADACLSEEQVDQMRRCIRTDLDCADVCFAAGRVLLRQTERDGAAIRALVEACRETCLVCAEECEKHRGKHEHCGLCADVCRDCEHACATLLSAEF